MISPTTRRYGLGRRFAYLMRADCQDVHRPLRCVSSRAIARRPFSAKTDIAGAVRLLVARRG